MQSFSPLTRKIIALGILVLLLLSGLNLALLLVGMTRDSLSDLEDARFRQARLDALRARPLPRPAEPLPRDLHFVGPDAVSAGQLLVGAVNQAAAASQLPLENVALLPADPALPQRIAVTFAATGPEEAILNFINDLEKQRPAVRLYRWRIAPTDAQPPTLRLEARAIAAWSST